MKYKRLLLGYLLWDNTFWPLHISTGNSNSFNKLWRIWAKVCFFLNIYVHTHTHSSLLYVYIHKYRDKNLLEGCELNSGCVCLLERRAFFYPRMASESVYKAEDDLDGSDGSATTSSVPPSQVGATACSECTHFKSTPAFSASWEVQMLPLFFFM